jgi:cob(I)alamin adenosyltransferase
MLYTGKGDNGTTKVFDSKDRISKSSVLIEALGALDEINSFLGLCKVKALKAGLHLETGKMSADSLVHSLQEDLFIIQAQIAGSEIAITPEKVKRLEELTDGIEKSMPLIKSFFISGGTELASLFDVSRVLARQAERRVVALKEASDRKISGEILAYLNRLSSILYALARYANYQAGSAEKSPSYHL